MERSEFLTAARAICGPAAVLSEPADMARFLTDWRGMFHGAALAVLRPASTAEVSGLMRLCHDQGIAVVPQGGNTGLAAGATPDESGHQVVLSLERMTAVREVDPRAMLVIAEAGVVLQHLREVVDDAGRLLPIAIASEGSATVGGVVSTNAGGSNVLRYGMTRDLVLGLEVVLPDGAILDGLRRLRKDNAGLDWKHLFIGTEGALGVVTAAVLRLVPRPSTRAVAFLRVAGLSAATDLLDMANTRLGETLTAFEVMAPFALKLVGTHFPVRPPGDPESWAVLIEVASSLPGVSDAFMEFVEAALAEGLVSDGTLAASEAQSNELWSIRERITEAEARAGASLKHDISLPVDAMARSLREIETALLALDPRLRVNLFGHLGDGNLHLNVLLAPESPRADITTLIHDRVARAGGSISAEHGLGQYRLADYVRLAPDAETDIARRVKRALDPDGGLNPGKALPM